MQISIDNISYFKCKKIPDPKDLMCCICYCLITKNGKQCKNGKCLKIYCAECNLKLVFHDNPCSYCRISKEYIGLDNDIITCLDNLLFYCPEFECKEQYTLEEYKLNHNHENKNPISNQCNICKFSLVDNPNFLTCNVCNLKYCFRNIEYTPYKVKKDCIKKFNDTDSCMKRCINCLTPVCNKCNLKYYKYKLNNFICEFCDIKCEICSNNISITYCDYCHKSICENCLNCDEANKLILCKNDYNKNDIKNKAKIYFVSEKYEQCPICKEKIKDINDLVKCKQDNCSNKFICFKCSLFCNICKKIICKNCSLFCNQCPPNASLVSCKSCNSNTIKKCSKEDCNNKLCINCYNSCNQCNTILCDKHKYQCLNCQDSMCEKHYSICQKCDKDKEGYKKACLKKCTYKCAFCDNMNNELCNKDNHKNVFVQKYNCEHNVCLQCVKKCENCKKIVITCPTCTVDYFFEYCSFCNKYKCFDCGKQCQNCEDYYCDYSHQCHLCNTTIPKNTCLKCIINSRVKCLFCRKVLKQCEECKKLLVCSKKCYLVHKKEKFRHLCQMFICDDCSGKYDNNNNVNNAENARVEIFTREGIMNNDINSSNRKIANNNINVLNNQTTPLKIKEINTKNSIDSIEDKKKVCCDCCLIY